MAHAAVVRSQPPAGRRSRGEIWLLANEEVLVQNSPLVRNKQVAPRFRLRFAFVCTLGILLCLASEARAGFIFDFAPQNAFTLVNTNADGSVNVQPNSITLTGGNDLSLNPGTTDYLATASTSGTVNFDWSYSSLDLPTFDFAGYLLNSNFFPLADTDGQSGTATFSVLAGQSFGLRVGTVDNSGEPGLLTVTSPVSAVPEPGAAPILSLLIAIGAVVILTRRAGRLEIQKRINPAAKLALVLLVGGAIVVHAQINFNYTGSNITGQLAINGPQVNLLSLSQQVQALRALAIIRPEATPKTPPKFLPPLPPFQKTTAQARVMRGAISHASVPSTIQNLPVVPASGGFGFNGLTHLDQRNANNGNQYSVEPPNASIAVANGYILQGVNNAVQVYSTAGTPLLSGPLATNQVFGLAPAINRATGISGVFPTDMRVFYDQGINRWFILQRAQCCDAAGNNVNHSQIYIAVSQTGDPTGTYNNYFIDTTDSHRTVCPNGCVADYPQIGADQYGFYISSDEYPIGLDGNPSQRPVGATILAISKDGLAAGVATPTTFEFILPTATGFEFAIAPAVTPPGAPYSTGLGGVEFFVSSIATGDSNLSVWAMTNTISLKGPSPNLALARIVVPTQPYTPPPNAIQRPGPLPYGSTVIPGFEAPIDTSDCRMLSLVSASGRLYAAFDALVTDSGGVLAGAAYFVLSPTFRGALSATVLAQGFLQTKNNYLLRPAFGVTPKGTGAIAVTLAGPDYYPSAAFVPIAPLYASTGTLSGYSAGPIEIASPGVFPEDGFTGYQTGVARWGDYSTSVTGSDGSIWMVTEFIPNAPRTTFANWGTFLTQYMP